MKSIGVIVFAGLALAGSAAQAETQRVVDVRVTMTKSACVARPGIVMRGTALFAIVNRTKRPRLFTIAGKRSRYIRAGRTGALWVDLNRAGVYRYFCISRGRVRNPRTGVMAVRAEGAPPPSEHRIGVRVVEGAGEFFDRATGERFVPRGNNYLRRATQQLGNGSRIFRGSTFIVGRYDSARAQAALERMHVDGYNAVRVFLDVNCRDGCLGDFRTQGLSSVYVDNLVDFLRRAKANEIQVMLTSEGNVPAGTTWETTVNRSCCVSFAGTNLYYLTPGGLEATQQFWQTLLRELIARRAPLDTIYAYSLANEAHFEANQPPLSSTSGSFTTANGRTYDMGSSSARQRMMDENLINFVDLVRASIRVVDPTAIVGMGFFWPQAPNPARPNDPRLIRTGPVIEDSALDYVDLHLYPGLELSFRQYSENFELPHATSKPVVMGEFGIFRESKARAAEAAYELQEWQRESCQYGFDGWLLWTWDTTEGAPGEPELWNALSEGGVIERSLAPTTRPDPCAIATGPHNIAVGKPATASLFEPAQPPSLAVDGLLNTYWSSGDVPPQWVRIDLGSPRAVSRIRLHVTQFPDGYTDHKVWGRATPAGSEQLLHEFASFTRSGDVLELEPKTPWQDVRYLRVATVTSPSWVGWREIEAISAG